MNNWQLGDYIEISYSNGTKGWGRLEYEVTEDDAPLANGAEPGDFLWRPMSWSGRAIHGTPVKLDELGAREVQDRRLWVNFPYQKARMVVLDDLQYVALHGALKLHERLMRVFDQAVLNEEGESDRAEKAHQDRQAKQEATRRLGGRDNTRDRRKTKREMEATAAREMAAKLVNAARYEACGIVACQLPSDDDAPSFWDRGAIWHALERHAEWRHHYTLATNSWSGMDQPLVATKRVKRETDIVKREAHERADGLKRALRAPTPPRAVCECCGQLGPDPDDPTGGVLIPRIPRTA